VSEPQDRLVGQLGWTFDPDNPVWTRYETPPHSPLEEGIAIIAYLWARTILCEGCTALIPLSPSWQLSKSEGLRLWQSPLHTPAFEVVPLRDASSGTISKAIATCPFCGRTTPQGHIAKEAEEGLFGHLHYADVLRRTYKVYTKRSVIFQHSAKYYRVPPTCLLDGDRERWRVLVAKGWTDEALTEDPLMAGILHGSASFAPGVEELI